MTHPAEGKLLPCPFCGAQPTTDRAGVPGKFGPIPTVRCTNEECFGPHTTAQFLADAVKQWNTRHSQGGKASMTSANLAALIHEARFPEGKDAPNYIPFLHEDRSGREYCLRIARKIIEAIELAPTPSPAVSAIELAYGLLWCMSVNRRAPNGWLASEARKALLAQLDKDGQARGIMAARAAFSREEKHDDPTSSDYANEKR